MKIALCGPEATGKTTLAQGLSQRLGLPLMTDPRGTLHAGYATLHEAAKVLPVWQLLLDGQMARERATPAGIFDFCALDAWVLLMRWGWSGLTPEAVEAASQSCRESVGQYDHLLIMPEQQVAPFAGHRFLNAANARCMHQLTLMTTSQWPLRSVTILQAGSMASLLDQAVCSVCR